MDGICGCLMKLSADVNPIRSNDECLMANCGAPGPEPCK